MVTKSKHLRGRLMNCVFWWETWFVSQGCFGPVYIGDTFCFGRSLVCSASVSVPELRFFLQDWGSRDRHLAYYLLDFMLLHITKNKERS